MTDVARTEGLVRLRAGVRPDSLVDLSPLRGIPAGSSPLEVERLLGKADRLDPSGEGEGGWTYCYDRLGLQVVATRVTPSVPFAAVRTKSEVRALVDGVRVQERLPAALRGFITRHTTLRRLRIASDQVEQPMIDLGIESGHIVWIAVTPGLQPQGREAAAGASEHVRPTP
jgi:hypothetical protein